MAELNPGLTASEIVAELEPDLDRMVRETTPEVELDSGFTASDAKPELELDPASGTPGHSGDGCFVSRKGERAPVTGNDCDLYAHHSTARILMPLHYSLVFVIGLVGNLLALVVIVQNRKKINSTTLYSTNLVISDILFTTALPTRIAYYALGFDWRVGDALCRITALVFYINTYAGVNFMTCLSIDRFFAVVHPLRYNKMKRIEHAKGVCIFVWILVFGQTLPLLINPMSRKEAERTTCMEYPNFEETESLPWILLGACFIGYVLPLTIILICYSQICCKLFKTAKQNPLTEKSGVNKKALNTIILIIVVSKKAFSSVRSVRKNSLLDRDLGISQSKTLTDNPLSLLYN
ncbi:G-protein coupled receptor 183 [Tupaia chinensis]|uniref:G-protein coupled receptor 183 n=1 Tax=Tupaia chinensis TaxID=246437 RepID=L9LA35_TUPCH|nr:G-protein coupled receptor 183 [Tupaia chinensis]